MYLELSTNGLWVNDGKTFIRIAPVGDDGKEFYISIMDLEKGSMNIPLQRDELRALPAYAEYNLSKTFQEGERI